MSQPTNIFVTLPELRETTKHIIKSAGYSQEKAAELAGIPPSTLRNYLYMGSDIRATALLRVWQACGKEIKLRPANK